MDLIKFEDHAQMKFLHNTGSRCNHAKDVFACLWPFVPSDI